MIGLFNDNFPPVYDGVALTVKNYADWMAKKGRQISVVTPYTPGLIETPYPIFTYHSLPLLMRKPYRIGLPFTDYIFRKHLSRLQFSIVHAHCPFTSGLLAVKVARKHNIPLVATFHSKYRQDFERALHSKKIVDQAVKQIVSFYEKADEVWIPQATVEPTLREYGYKGKVTVVDNGSDLFTPDDVYTDLRNEMRKTLGVKNDEVMLLFVGQHIWEKNIGFILDSIAIIKDLPYKLFMIGTGYAVSDIQKKINTLGIENKVRLLGVVKDRDMLRSYYSAADMFLFPSLYDNAPLVVREAAALRTPAIMLQGSTASEIINDGENGFLTPNDTSAYAGIIKHLMENPDMIRKVGDNASKTIVRSWEDVVEEVLCRYDDICARYNRERK